MNTPQPVVSATIADKYVARGFRVLPAWPDTKRPSLQWIRYQEQAVSRELLLQRFGEGHNIGALLGKASGNIVVLDFDTLEIGERWCREHADIANRTWIVQTTRGLHVFVRCDDTRSSKFTFKGQIAGDFLGCGRFVVLPPSVIEGVRRATKSGTPNDDFPLCELEDLDIERSLDRHPSGPAPGSAADLPAVIEQGQRHKLMVRTAVKARRAGLGPDTLAAAVHALNVAHCRPPLAQEQIVKLCTWVVAHIHPNDPGLSGDGWRVAGGGEWGMGRFPPSRSEGDCATTKEDALGGVILRAITDQPPLPATPYPPPDQNPVTRHPPPDQDPATRHPSPATRLPEEEPMNPTHHLINVIAADGDVHGYLPVCAEIQNEIVEAVEFQETDEYLKDAMTEFNWLVPDLIPEGFLVVLGGTSKAGKSCLVMTLANAIAGGKPFLGRECCQSPVIWLAFEESKGERAMAADLIGGFERGIYTSHNCAPIDTPEGIEAITRIVKETKAKLIVIDPLYGAVKAESLTGGREARKALQMIKELCNQSGAAAIILHHFTKAAHLGLTRERLADSNQIAAAASMDILMEAQIQPDKSRLIRLACRGRGLFANTTLILASPGPGQYELVGEGEELTIGQVETTVQVKRCIQDSAPLYPDGMTAEDIADRTKLSLKTIQNQLVALTKSGHVIVKGKTGKWKLYAMAS